MGYDRRRTPAQQKTSPTRTPARNRTLQPTGPARPTGPVRRPDQRFGPAGSSDEIGHGGDHLFGPGNMELQRVMLAKATTDGRGSMEGTTRGGTTRGGGTRDTYGPAGSSDEIGQGPDFPGFLGGIDSMFA